VTSEIVLQCLSIRR